MSAAGDKEASDNSSERAPRAAGNERRLTIVDNRVESRELFMGTRDIVIVHGREAYRLRLTAQNKLILTK